MIAPEEAWDRDLAADEVKELSPRNRSRRTVESFRRKVALMERWAIDGLPEGVEPKKNRTQLRSWHDAQERLWPWSDPVVDGSRGKNKDLHGRFVAALEAIRARQKGSSRARGARLTVDVAVHQALLVQNATQLAEILDLRRQVLDLRRQVRSLSARKAA